MNNRDRQRALRLNLIMVLASLAYLGWTMTPPHTRQLWAMQTTAWARKALTSCARHAGRAAMTRELQGDEPAYELPYLLSLARDRLGALYDHMRPIP